MGATVVLSANDGWNIVNYRKGLIKALQTAGYELVVIAPDGPQRAAIAALGLRFEPLAMAPRGRSPLTDIGLLLGFVRVLRRVRPAAFLGFTAKPNIYGSLAAGLCGVPVINNISGLGWAFSRGGWMRSLVSMLYRLALRRSKTVFFQNRDDRGLFEKLGLVSRRQSALLPGSGVDLDHFSPRPARSADGQFAFLLAARLLWDKGISEYVQAARRLRAGRAGLCFRIVGIVEPPSAEAVSEEQLRHWASDGLVTFLGSAEDVRPLFAAADCVVLPSYYREGVPRVLLEASAMAIPVITADSPGCREAVDDGVTGLLCAPRSIDSLAAAMERMLAMSAEQRHAMGVAGRAKMQRAFREELVHRAYLDALGKLGVAKS